MPKGLHKLITLSYGQFDDAWLLVWAIMALCPMSLGTILLMSGVMFDIDIPWYIGLPWWISNFAMFCIWCDAKMNVFGQCLFFILAMATSIVGLLAIPVILLSLLASLFSANNR